MKSSMLIVSGRGGVGKSTAVSLAFEGFLQWTVRTVSQITVHYLYRTARDVGAVIEVGEQRIGIASKGDTSAHVEHGLAFFESQNCSYILCVTRSSGSPLDAAHAHSQEQWNKAPEVWAKTSDVGAKAQQTANAALAARLLRRLKQACAA